MRTFPLFLWFESLLAVILSAGLILLALPAAGQSPSPPPEERIAQQLLDLADQVAQDPNFDPVAAYPALVFDATGTRVGVRITSSDVDTLLPALEALGFETIGAFPDLNFVEGTIPIDQIRALAGLVDQGLLGVIPVYAPISDPGGGPVTGETPPPVVADPPTPSPTSDCLSRSTYKQ